MNYLFAAYTMIWIILFGYVFTLARRQHRLKEEIDRMGRVLNSSR